MDELDRTWPEWNADRAYRPHYPDYPPDKPPARIRENFLKAVREIRQPDPQLELFERKNGRASSGSRRPAVIQ
jgi:hypothetical protein